MKRAETVPQRSRPSSQYGVSGTAGGATTDPMLSLPSLKVKDWHLQRKAIVYIRQSTLQQVRQNLESSRRQ